MFEAGRDNWPRFFTCREGEVALGSAGHFLGFVSKQCFYSRVAKKPSLKENTFNFQSVAMFSCLSFGLF